MSESLFVFTIVLIAATCVLIFGVRAWASFQGARTREAREEAYHALAARSAEGQSEAASQMAAAHGELARISTRLAAIEAVLKSVD